MTRGEHYYSRSPQARHDPGQVTLKVGNLSLTLHTDAGVFSKERIDRGTRLLIEALVRGSIPLPERGAFLDLGCGYGPLGLAMAVLRPEADVYMVDVNERAVGLARDNARQHGLDQVQVVQGEGLAPFPGQSFHVIVTNPPLRTGKENVYAMLREAYAALLPEGILAAVIRTQQGAKSMERFLQELAPRVEEVEKGGGFRVYVAYRT